jgi:hypothetical protein
MILKKHRKLSKSGKIYRSCESLNLTKLPDTPLSSEWDEKTA